MLTGRLARDGSIAELAHASLPARALSGWWPSLPFRVVDEVLLRSLDPVAEGALRLRSTSFVERLPLRAPRDRLPGRPGSVTRYQTPDTTYAPLPSAPGHGGRLPVLLALVTPAGLRGRLRRGVRRVLVS